MASAPDVAVPTTKPAPAPAAPHYTPYKAFYSTVSGQFVSDYSLMNVPFDDHMVHRGHSIFDTSNIVDGHCWGMEAHMDRFFRSAKLAKIDIMKLNLPRHDDDVKEPIAATECEESKKQEILDLGKELIAFAGVKHGELRYWLSVGVGDLNLDPYGCLGPNLYMIVREIPAKTAKWLHQETFPLQAPPLRLVTSPVPNKPPPFCVLKSTNYLQNAHCQMDARERGANFGIFVYQSEPDVESKETVTLVAEGPSCNVVFIDNAGKFVVPKFSHSLRGVTLLRAIELVERSLEKGELSHVTGVSIQDVELDEVLKMSNNNSDDVPDDSKSCYKECFIFSSGNMASPVSHWDDKYIGYPKKASDDAMAYGPGAAELQKLMIEDMKPGSDFMTPIKYNE